MPSPSPQSALRYPVNAVLGNPGNVRLMRELFRHGGELTAPQLAARTGMTAQGVRATLAALERSGAVEAIGSARARLYRARRSHPLAPALEALFRDEEDRHAAILAAVTDAAGSEPDIYAAWLYGSVARGEDRHDSDLDIVIVTQVGCRTICSARMRSNLNEAAERLAFTPSIVSLDRDDVRRLAAGDPWWTEMERDALTLKGDPPNVFARRLVRRETDPA